MVGCECGFKRAASGFRTIQATRVSRNPAINPNGGIFDSHLFFYDRYSDLADYHRLQGRISKADRLAAIGEGYYQAAPDDDDEPEAAALAMSAPRLRINTNAVSATRVPKTATGRIIRCRSIARTLNLRRTEGLWTSIQTKLKYGAEVPIRPIHRGDRVTYHGNPGVIELVVEALTGEQTEDWLFETRGAGITVAEPNVFGRVYLPDPHEE